MVKTYFFDTSALAKRYITETDSHWVRAMTDPNSGTRIILSRIKWLSCAHLFFVLLNRNIERK